jgi:hypothetical protein
MAEDLIKQVEPHIREILRICSILKVEGKEVHELNALVGQTSKWILFDLYQYAEEAEQFKITLSG